MSALSIQPTYPIFTDIDGQPLEDGYVWIGQANLDPQVNPINVYWDAALTLPAGQPIRTLAGYPSNNGTPARLYVNSDYSIRVMNKNGSVVYSASAATERYSDAVVTGINAEDVKYDPPFVGGVQTNVEAKLAQTVSVKDFGAVGDGVTDDTVAIQAAIDSGAKCLVFPEGTYIVNQLNPSSPVPTSPYNDLYCFSLYLNTNQDLQLVSLGATIKRSSSPVNCSFYEMFRFNTNGKVSITGFTFEAVPGVPGAGNTPPTIVGRATGLNGFLFANNRMVTCGGWYIYGGTDVKIDNNEFGSGVDHLALFDNAGTYMDGVFITNNRFIRPWFDSIDINDGVTNFVISGNYFEDANYEDLEISDNNEHIDIGGANFQIKKGVVSDNIFVQKVGTCDRFIYVKQGAEDVTISNNRMIWSAPTKKPTNIGIDFYQAGNNNIVSGNYIFGVDDGIKTTDVGGTNLSITDNVIKDFSFSGIYIIVENGTVNGNRCVIENAAITTANYGIRLDTPNGCVCDGNVIDMFDSADSFGVFITSDAAKKPSMISNNSVISAGIGIVYNSGNGNIEGNNISNCYGGSIYFSGKNVQVSNNMIQDGFRSGQNVVVNGITSYATIEGRAIYNVVCSGNQVGEGAGNTEIGKIYIDNTSGGQTMVLTNNMVTTDTSICRISYENNFTAQAVANNVPTAVVGS
jgi:hypothetical protein